MRIEEFQSSLGAQELCLSERNFEKELEQALKAKTLKESFVKNNQKQVWLENKKKYGDGAQNSELFNSEEKKHMNVQKGKEKFDKRKIQCYSCNKFGYFNTDCWLNKVKNGEEANIDMGYSDDEPV